MQDIRHGEFPVKLGSQTSNLDNSRQKWSEMVDLMVIQWGWTGLYSDLMDYEWDIPSGNDWQFAIENGAGNSGFFPI